MSPEYFLCFLRYPLTRSSSLCHFSLFSFLPFSLFPPRLTSWFLPLVSRPFLTLLSSLYLTVSLSSLSQSLSLLRSSPLPCFSVVFFFFCLFLPLSFILFFSLPPSPPLPPCCLFVQCKFPLHFYVSLPVYAIVTLRPARGSCFRTGNLYFRFR